MAENPQIPTTAENPQIPTEIIKIPLFEQERSEYLEVFRDAMRYVLDTDVFGLWNPDSYLHTGQRFYDIQCACVEPFNMGGVLSHPAYTRLIEKLYEKRHDRDKCPICLAKDCIDTITHCGHAYCFRCVAPWLNEKNICPECRQPCSIETIAMLSSKMTYVFNSVDQLVQTKEKIVVFAQNLGVIALLQHALLGHKRADSMFIWEWNSNDIQEFLNSPYKILLMPLNALQGPMLLHEMVAVSGGDPGARIEKMSMLLKKIKDHVQIENLVKDDTKTAKGVSSGFYGLGENDTNHQAPAIPSDFKCPISLELMMDPVIVSTGQTYERSCIEKWLQDGHGTCPKTQQSLTSTVLTPNYVLRSLIEQWCEANGIEPPKRPSTSEPSKSASACTPAERSKIESLIQKLTSGGPEDQRSAAGEIRLLAKRNADNRVAIAEAGAIPLLVGLLSVPDSRTQEHAVTALLNLSIYESNKGSIVSSGAVPGIVHVLKRGSMEARENAAATLFSLSVIDENKVTIGSSGAISPLVTLLSEGTQRGKKDAATALFNLCIYQGNKGKAVRAGVIPTLMRLLTEPSGGMVDEALAILAILASHPEGKAAIGAAEAVPVLVEFIGNGSPRNKENAAAVLVHLCSGDRQYIAQAQELGVMAPLLELAQNGTDRGKRKATQLIERMSRIREQEQHEVPTQTELQAQNDDIHPPLVINLDIDT